MCVCVCEWASASTYDWQLEYECRVIVLMPIRNLVFLFVFWLSLYLYMYLVLVLVLVWDAFNSCTILIHSWPVAELVHIATLSHSLSSSHTICAIWLLLHQRNYCLCKIFIFIYVCMSCGKFPIHLELGMCDVTHTHIRTCIHKSGCTWSQKCDKEWKTSK